MPLLSQCNIKGAAFSSMTRPRAGSTSQAHTAAAVMRGEGPGRAFDTLSTPARLGT